ncbi:MAG: bifunctional riboflavin kinase/FAD synthetase [Candidatus Omnitrophota bacterium]|nr:MAG: bifunctional riboflavin kinase/FAD synthetase [Candidatus Omnitrophota bacterium]
MKVIRGIKNLKKKLKKPVVTIGIFDGVHLGHRRVIREVVRQAKASKGTSVVITFHPHPLKILQDPDVASLITSLEHRIDLIRQLGADVCLILDFNKGFSRIPAKRFIKNILVERLSINYLILEKGFRFGRQRKGSFELLEKSSRIYGFKVKRIGPVKKNGRIISSSRIRALIQEGKVKQANRLLGRVFSIFGKVEKGNAWGRRLGYPTANIVSLQEIVPLPGVYAVKILVDKKIFPGILNVGWRPTFYAERKLNQTIEVHIFNFSRRLYGKRLEVFFVRRIRPEKRFPSHKTLLTQIKKDEQRARIILKTRTSPPIIPHLVPKI